MPFVFIITRDAETVKINGEGNGSNEFSKAALEELKLFTGAQFEDLVRRTKKSYDQE